MGQISYKDIYNNEEIKTYIEMGNHCLGTLGYTDHSRAHAMIVAENGAKILQELGYSEKEINLCRIAGYMHDIGNAVNRHDHAHNGAIMAFNILRDLGMEPEDIAVIISAIGNHDEKTGNAVTPVSAALIIADKTDVRRNRVRTKIKANFDIHDRVNYAVFESKVEVIKEKNQIHMDINLDEEICSVLDYFEIFLDRMIMCRRGAEVLGMKFKLTANGNKVL